MPDVTPVLEAKNLIKTFPVRRDVLGRVTERITAVDGVDLRLGLGETIGIVGESGSGKTTVGRMLAHLVEPDSGEITVAGRRIGRGRADRRWLRRQVQMIFQDPFSSLDPTKTVGHAVREPLIVQRIGDRAHHATRVDELLDKVGLLPSFRDRYPEELSGGQRQRVAIARALAPGPPLLVADEPTSALDLSTRSEILNLLLRLQADADLSMVVISHDFATIRHISHRIAVMYMGAVVEHGPAGDIADRPTHPYTRALMSAVPSGDPSQRRRGSRIVLTGPHPNPAALPPGCRFQGRCPEVQDVCRHEAPPLREVSPGHWSACHFAEAVGAMPELALAMHASHAGQPRD
jgi:oligopeptide/dipeptide ABC transporter ATP-binding protein